MRMYNKLGLESLSQAMCHKINIMPNRADWVEWYCNDEFGCTLLDHAGTSRLG